MKNDLLAPLRNKMAAEHAAHNGPRHWRSIAHKEGAVDTEREFLHPVPTSLTESTRRDALKLAGASLAMTSLAACVRRPEEEILPYSKHPPEVTPGIPNYYASFQPRAGGGFGIVVESHEGRPSKIEGNPLHSSSRGASDVWAQAELLRMYDPDRLRFVLHKRQGKNWNEWDAFAKTHFDAVRAAGGAGLVVVADGAERPTFDRLLADAQKQMPQMKVFRIDALLPDNSEQGAEIAVGPGARVHHDLSAAKVIFSLDSDFLKNPAMAKGWAANRRVLSAQEADKLGRLYAAEGVFSMTGTNADHRLRIAAGQGRVLLQALAAALGMIELAAGAKAPAEAASFVAALAKDIQANPAQSVVVVGERQPAEVHALALAINVQLGSKAQSISVVDGAQPRQTQGEQLKALAEALNSGSVQTLLNFDVNLVHAAPGALKMGEALKKAKTTIFAGLLEDETGLQSEWCIPLAHFLEAWSDGRGADGTAAVVQPLILPLWNARADVQLAAQTLLGNTDIDRALVEKTWSNAGVTGAAWRKALHDGVLPSHRRMVDMSSLTPTNPLRTADVAAKLTALPVVPAPSAAAMEIALTTGNLLDGRLANVPWTQELPDTMTKLVWDNALVVSPALAKELGLKSGVERNAYTADIVKVTANGGSVELPTFVLPGMDKFSAYVNIGYGRSTGEIATGIGHNVAAIMPASGGRLALGAKLERTGAQTQLASTQDHFAVSANMLGDAEDGTIINDAGFAALSGLPAGNKDRNLNNAGRQLVRHGSLVQYKEQAPAMKDPVKKRDTFAHKGDIPENLVRAGTRANQPTKPLQPISDVIYEGQQWGMVIDLTACTGCNACAIACVAENNIATVGRDQVMYGRELHWMRIDRYFEGDVDNPISVHQPVACLHCELAPCEPVCPVAATVHDEEGINSMAYNRCIGTRYCANNCPYKVRRFNYLDFTVTGNVYRNPHQAERHDIYKMARNPDVTVRYRGVMEKCTYCTQRVEEAKISFKRAGGDRKQLPDGAVTPACAQACPTDAIVFGNINDPKSRVNQLKQVDRNYETLQELNIRPRTTYLARLTNKNKDLVGG
jgi:Fe-S-cluster-containing dehydrogenase component/anaerobic selenocysteine-containing dehydrogenase